MNISPLHTWRSLQQQKGAAGWILLWLLGIPIPHSVRSFSAPRLYVKTAALVAAVFLSVT